jgi:tRNA (cmo5U34)-methyltransferase
VSDNTTAHAASDYEVEVARTIPFHEEILRTAVDVVLADHLAPRRWLDTGCGPGKLVTMVRAASPSTETWLADPSEAMLALARARHTDLPAARFIAKGSADLPDAPPFDAITAVQCHHYGDETARERALTRCRALLAKEGMLVVFENVRAETEAGHALQRKRLAAWQRRMGKDDDAITKHLAREGTAFFPIRVSEHLALFARLGFETEIVWRAYNQAGFTARIR